MRRVVSVVLATVGVLALLASFHTTSGLASKSVTGVIHSTRPPAGGSPPARSSTTPSSSSTPGSTAATPSTSASAPQTFTGPVVSNRYGDVQVQISVAGGRLSDVEALQLPSDRQRSQEINSIAGPDLRQEALQAQSANINIVSGATYTSDSYAQSLQAALNQAGL